MSLPGSGVSHLSLYEVLKCNFFTTPDKPSPVLCLQFSSNGELIVSGHSNGAVKVVHCDDRHQNRNTVLSLLGWIKARAKTFQAFSGSISSEFNSQKYPNFQCSISPLQGSSV